MESKPKTTPQKAEPGKSNFSPYKREANNKKYKSTPEKGDAIRSVKKETTAVRKLTDFKRQTVEEKEASKPKGSLVSEVNEDGTERLLWVDKYKPGSLKAIIGQQGEQSCANKLLRWLRNWHKNTSEDGQSEHLVNFLCSFMLIVPLGSLDPCEGLSGSRATLEIGNKAAVRCVFSSN